MTFMVVKIITLNQCRVIWNKLTVVAEMLLEIKNVIVYSRIIRKLSKRVLRQLIGRHLIERHLIERHLIETTLDRNLTKSKRHLIETNLDQNNI